MCSWIVLGVTNAYWWKARELDEHPARRRRWQQVPPGNLRLGVRRQMRQDHRREVSALLQEEGRPAVPGRPRVERNREVRQPQVDVDRMADPVQRKTTLMNLTPPMKQRLPGRRLGVLVEVSQTKVELLSPAVY